MKPFGWTRSFVLVLLCLLAVAPAAVHARVCLVSLGLLERSECCAPRSCCAEESPAGPAVEDQDSGCHCCLDVDLDSSQLVPLISSPGPSLPDACAYSVALFTLPALPEPPATELARACFARAGPPPRPPAAPLPLRI